MNIINRAKDIVLNPKPTWQQIEQEPSSVKQLYTQYYMILALIPAIAGFIGSSIVGVGMFGMTVRVPIVSGLVQMVLSYAMGLASVYILSLIINALAPKFGGISNPLNALKIAVYASTAALLGGFFAIIPMLSILGILTGLYSIYLLYLGLPVLMKNPQDKSVTYTIVIFIAAIILAIVVGTVVSLFSPKTTGLNTGGDFKINTPNGQISIGAKDKDGKVSINTPNGEISFDAKAMEDATKRVEEAKTPEEISAAMGEAMQTATGQSSGTYDAETLKQRFPETLAGLKRLDISSSKQSAMGVNMAEASAKYGNDSVNISLKLQDLGMAVAQAYHFAPEKESENSQSAEKQWRADGRYYDEYYQKDGTSASYKVMLKNGVMFEAQGNTNIKQLREIANQLGLAQLENTPRPKTS